MTNPNNVDKEELFNRLTSTLKQVQTCVETFADNPKYPPSLNGVNGTVLTQFKALSEAAKKFTTPSYEFKAQDTRKNNRIR